MLHSIFVNISFGFGAVKYEISCEKRAVRCHIVIQFQQYVNSNFFEFLIVQYLGGRTQRGGSCTITHAVPLQTFNF